MKRKLFSYAVIVVLFFSLVPLQNLAADTPLSVNQDRILSIPGFVNDVEYSPFKTYLAAATRDNIVRVWNSDLRLLWNHHGRYHYFLTSSVLGFTPDEKYLLFTKYKTPEDIALLNLQTWEVDDILSGHSNELKALGVSRDGQYVLSAAYYGEMKLWSWDGTTFVITDSLEKQDSSVELIRPSPVDDVFVCAHGNDKLKVWKASDGKLEFLQLLEPKQYYGNTGYLYGVNFSPDGKYLATALREEITIWKREGDSFSPVHVIPELKSGYVQSLEFSEDGKYMAVGFGRGRVSIFSTAQEGWKQVEVLAGRQDYVLDLDFSPDSKELLASSVDSTAVIFYSTDGIAPDPVMQIRMALDSPLSNAQKRVLTREEALAIIDSFDPFLFEEKDEFETDDEYEERKEELKFSVLKKIQQLQEKSYSLEVSGKGETVSVAIPLEGLGTYDIKTSIYPVRFMETGGSIKIDRNDARNLKRSWEKTRITATRKTGPDGIAWEYGNFTLIHPVSSKEYPVSLSSNPFHHVQQAPKDDSREYEVGPFLLARNLSIPPIFPVLYRYYDNSPVGSIQLVNTGPSPIDDISVSLFIRGYMDHPKTGTTPGSIRRGEKATVDIYALFNDSVLSLTEGDTVAAELTIRYSSGGKKYDSSIIRSVTLLDRNAVTWDDDKKIGAFMTVKDPGVMKLAKNVSSIPPEPAGRAFNKHMTQAIKVYETLRTLGINYIIDPSSPYKELADKNDVIDFIQFPSQTLDFKGGDCDDLSILYNSLLEALGIETAYITVPGHIFTAFSLGISKAEAFKLFGKPENLIFKDDAAWMPVETTLLSKGFLNAWETAANEWNKYNKEGSASLFTTGSAWKLYAPVNFQQDSETIQLSEKSIAQSYSNQLDTFVKNEMGPREEELLTKLEKDRDDPKLLNKLGILYSRYGYYDDALEFFKRVLSNSEYLPAIMNIGNVYALQGKTDSAMTYYLKALRKAPENPKILLTLTRAYLKQGEITKAEETLGRARQIDPGLAVSFPEITAASGSRASQASTPYDDVLDEEWE